MNLSDLPDDVLAMIFEYDINILKKMYISKRFNTVIKTYKNSIAMHFFNELNYTIELHKAYKLYCSIIKMCGKLENNKNLSDTSFAMLHINSNSTTFLVRKLYGTCPIESLEITEFKRSKNKMVMTILNSN